MFSNLYKKLKPILWFLPGFLLWAAYPPMGERMDCLFALSPLMWLSRREVSAGIVAKRWFQSGIVYWIATLSWMPAIVKNGGPWPLVVLGWFALAAYCAAYFAAYGWLSAKYWRWAKGMDLNTETQRHRGGYWRRSLGILVVEPVLWCGLELVRSRFLGGFAWNQLGVVPVNSGFGAPAVLGGVYLCSAVVILINGTIAGIVERMWKPERSGFANLKRLGSLETLLVFGVVWGLYWVASAAGTAETAGTHLKVAMVQRNFPCVFKQQEEKPVEVYERLLGNVAALRPDLVVLPESAMCEFGPVDQQGAVRFAEWVAKKTNGAALLAGGTRYEDGKTYNSAALYRVGVESNRVELGSGRVGVGSNRVEVGAGRVGVESNRVEVGAGRVGVESIQIYDKVHLVPFGEFIPGDKWITALQKLAPVGSCTPGGLKTLRLRIGRAQLGHLDCGVAICFEDTDSAQMRELAKMGANVLFFITNDSWFSQSVEAEQHAWQAVARAIETGLPVVRVGNSGVTGTITPDGKTSWLVGPNGRPLVDREGTMFDKVVIPEEWARHTRIWGSLYVRSLTPYVVFGDIPLGIAFALLILSMILVKYKAHYEQRRTLSL